MFFSNFGKEAADIVHDAQPTDEIIDDLMEVMDVYPDYFKRNGKLLLWFLYDKDKNE